MTSSCVKNLPTCDVGQSSQQRFELSKVSKPVTPPTTTPPTTTGNRNGSAAPAGNRTGSATPTRPQDPDGLMHP